jgi:small subunit ribosomal protein S7
MRRRRAEKRDIIPDPKFHNKLVAKLINCVMEAGKKSVAEGIVYNAFDIACKKLNKTDPLEVLQKAIDNARPLVELKPRRVGGATYQIPIEVAQERGVAMALRWIRNFARARKGKPMKDRLAAEIMDAFNNTGLAIKKKEDTHKMAEANKAFAHFRW